MITSLKYTVIIIIIIIIIIAIIIMPYKQFQSGAITRNEHKIRDSYQPTCTSSVPILSVKKKNRNEFMTKNSADKVTNMSNVDCMYCQMWLYLQFHLSSK